MQKVYLRSYDTEENLWISALSKKMWSTVQAGTTIFCSYFLGKHR